MLLWNPKPRNPADIRAVTCTNGFSSTMRPAPLPPPPGHHAGVGVQNGPATSPVALPAMRQALYHIVVAFSVSFDAGEGEEGCALGVRVRLGAVPGIGRCRGSMTTRPHVLLSRHDPPYPSSDRWWTQPSEPSCTSRSRAWPHCCLPRCASQPLVTPVTLSKGAADAF